MRVLVTDAGARAALAVTRSLGRAGYEVLAAERTANALAKASRYCALGLTYPDPGAEEQAFVSWLYDAVSRHSIDVVVPVADVVTMLVSECRAELEPRCRVACPDAVTVRRAADKVDLFHTACRLGVPVPSSVVVTTATEAPNVVGLGFPLVLKPHRSRIRTPGGWRSTAVSYAETPDDLRTQLERRQPFEFPILVQEYIRGDGMGIFACNSADGLRAVFGHRRLREKPPSGGVSVLAESVEASPDAKEYSIRLLRELQWSGVAMVEFKRDRRDGAPRLMEINGRFWGSLQLAIDAGVDFPRLLVEMVTGTAPPSALPAYHVGVRSRWLWGDLDSLLLRLRGGKSSRFSGEATTNWQAVLDFLRFWEANLYYDNPKLDDPSPWFYETLNRLRLQ